MAAGSRRLERRGGEIAEESVVGGMFGNAQGRA